MAAEDKTTLTIPVFREEELLLDNNGMFFLGRDSCYAAGANYRCNYTGILLRVYPTTALRATPDGNTYCCYGTDTGYRLYLFFDDYNWKTTPDGFPILVRELLPYQAFQGLKVGESMDAVTAIDPVTALYERQYREIWGVNTVATRSYAKDGYPIATLHYLKDGLLKIDYDMVDDKEFVIDRMEYYEDYVVVGKTGRTTNYKINELDLPPQGEWGD